MTKHKEKLGIVRVRQICSQGHGLDAGNYVLWLLSQLVNFIFISPTEALEQDQIDKQLCMLVRNPLLHIKKRVKHCLSCTEPFEVLGSKIFANNVNHLVKMFLVIYRDAISQANLVNLMLYNLFVSENCFFHNDIVR